MCVCLTSFHCLPDTLRLPVRKEYLYWRDRGEEEKRGEGSGGERRREGERGEEGRGGEGRGGEGRGEEERGERGGF